MMRVLFLLSLCLSLAAAEAGRGVVGEEEDWGEGLKVLVTYRPPDCRQRAGTGDVIHYHYVGRLASDGKIFGKRWAMQCVCVCVCVCVCEQIFSNGAYNCSSTHTHTSTHTQ